MRLQLIAAELAAACGLLAAVLAVTPGEAARIYALATIVASVLPGLMLTGDVKLLNAGVPLRASRLRLKTSLATAFNVPVVAAGLALFSASQHWLELAALTVLCSLGATAQAFSSAWFYLQPDKRRILRSKVAASAARLGFASAALMTSELMLALAGVTVGALVEFGLNFRTLPWQPRGPVESRHNVVSPLGAAYGLSRLVSAAVKVGLAQFFGPLIASFLVIEQLVGGVNSLFEKYLVRSTRWRSGLRISKLLYLMGMLAAVPWLVGSPLPSQDRTSLVWLSLLAGASLLPLAEMYAALQRRSQTFVAYGSAGVSLLVACLLGLSWLADLLAPAAVGAYVLLPGLTFLFYWWSGIHVRHDAEHKAP